MGLFKKKPANVLATDFLALRAEVTELRARLDSAEQDKAQLEDRLASLDASTTALAASHPQLTNLDELRNEVRSVGVRLSEVSTEVGRVRGSVEQFDGRLGSVDARVDQLRDEAARVAAVPPPPPPPPPPAAAPAGPDPELAGRLDELDQRLGALDTLQSQLHQLTARVAAQAELGAQLSSLRDRMSLIQDQVGQADAVRDQVSQLAQRTRSADEFSALLQQLSERIDRAEGAGRTGSDDLDKRVQQAVQPHIDQLRQHLEERLGSMGTELTNQISELGRDLDTLAHADTAGGLDVDALIEELRSGQVRLANEQARYEIAFRQDLAALAEQLRRQR